MARPALRRAVRIRREGRRDRRLRADEVSASANDTIQRLAKAGTSVWLDDLGRAALDSGEPADLARRGTRPQRPLWASTGVKDPAYDDTLPHCLKGMGGAPIVTGLVAPHTVNTMPRATLDALLDHGEVPGDTVRGGYREAREMLASLAAGGIQLTDIADELETDGVARFQDSWQRLTADVRTALHATARIGGEPRAV
ncbi:hypothetical protein OG761_08575 [Streptomyces tubercidicus]|nr:hypothetical protein OG761_08575 [Streptomyces tubercidicus]